ncbi:YidC/Oxa1 family membrane protein insertase [Patescibacteria group bacterium]|nr:YidC/Oxa1 family membrane protein insertase [Patescibacteria group bacterium]
MFHTLLIDPFYNTFIFLIGIMPAGDVGLAIIAVTLIIRVIFYPLFASNIRTQMGMQALQGELDEINTKYKDDAQKRGELTMDLFRKHKVRPISAFLSLLVQIPVFIALYYAFFHEGLNPIATDLLYSFVHAPSVIATNFFGLVDLMAQHNIPIAVLVAVLQYLVVRYSFTRMDTPSSGKESDKQRAQKLQRQMMLYFLPTLMGVVSYTVPAAVGIYFIAGSVISLGQEWLIQRQMAAEKA